MSEIYYISISFQIEISSVLQLRDFTGTQRFFLHSFTFQEYFYEHKFCCSGKDSYINELGAK